eukprot:TRINITY_DN9021_c0_g1_i2.p4 TRINITY_DN9021_c0_g1~~TRINITY_DN9021_c0_g1_i2.p4  ORF type:complete len:118 (+),score=26.20 TRINITY_DN9021_c0_g1_i2:1314-1667(+)
MGRNTLGGEVTRGTSGFASDGMSAGAASGGSGGSSGASNVRRPESADPSGAQAPEPVELPETRAGGNRRIEEEAISKLERLGYPREEIVRQLKDESSHLCKLYHRFLKALTAWDSKK